MEYRARVVRMVENDDGFRFYPGEIFYSLNGEVVTGQNVEVKVMGTYTYIPGEVVESV